MPFGVFGLVDHAFAECSRQSGWLYLRVVGIRCLEGLGWVGLARAEGLATPWAFSAGFMILLALLSAPYLAMPFQVPEPSFTGWCRAMGIAVGRWLVLGLSFGLPIGLLVWWFSSLTSPSEQALVFLISLPAGFFFALLGFYLNARLMPAVALAPTYGVLTAISMSWRQTKLAQLSPILVGLAVVWGLEGAAAILTATGLGTDSAGELWRRTWPELIASELIMVAIWRVVGSPVEIFAGVLRYYSR